MYVATQPCSCPYCSSNALVWDYRAGIVICSSCGSVIDVIYDSSPSYFTEATEVCSRVGLAKYFPKSLAEIERARKLVEVAERKARSIKVIKSLPEDDKRLCRYGVELAYKISPSLVEGKSLRSRYAVGYIVSMSIMGKPVDAVKISRMFKVSVSTVRRLMKNVSSKLDCNLCCLGIALKC